MTDRWPDKHACNIFSQYGEDGILAAVFDKISATSRYCVDVGAADGVLFSNVRQFIEYGWTGTLIECDADRFEKLSNDLGQREGIQCVNAKVETHGENSLDNILERAGVPEEFDLLSIDIDGQDYYIWNSLLHYRPRVVVIEYEPDVDPMFIPPLNGPGQAGWNATTYVAAARGYLCICKTRTNLICVRKDILDAIPGLQMTIGKSHEEWPQLDMGELCQKPNSESNERAESASNQFLQPQPNSESTPEPASDPVKIVAVISVPRLGFNANWHSTIKALLALQIYVQMVEGVFWASCLTRGIKKALSEGADIILTIDYDSIFDVQHVVKLCQLIADREDYDVLVPVQMKRESTDVLFGMNGSRDFTQEITPIRTGHFGLTVFDKSVFNRLPKPWFWGQPNKDGEWDDGKIDDDIYFWEQCAKANVKVGLANQVRIGHLELGITWPDAYFKPVRQSITDYRASGQPKECGGELRVEMEAAK